MSFMKPEILKKGALYCADCAKCGTTMYSHEWLCWTNNDTRDALQDGTAVCQDCDGTADPDTFMDCGRQYAGRYSASGYMDCTDWIYSPNLRTLKRELRDMYGD